MNRILVTGCHGQLGRAINRVMEGEPVTLINTDVDELDITDISAVSAFFLENRPDVVINCAAYTNVDACESQFDLAFRINAVGPRNLAICAERAGAKMVHISTDYVFDGTATQPINEFAAVAPIGAYGRTKLYGEQFVQTFSKRYFIIRTAWLYGEGKNFVKTMLRLAGEREEVGVVSDQFGTPTSAMELARMIKSLIPTENFGLFHGTCEGSCSWADFAEEIFRKAGLSTGVKRLKTEEYPTPAKRPAYSVLENYMLKMTGGYTFADWKDALDEYLKEA